MIAQSFPSVLRLRILVLALGEAHMSGWWKTQFLSVTGLSYLNRLYPRSSFAAAVRSASRAAKAAHDSSIGVGNVFHLFRLPQQHERRLEEFNRRPYLTADETLERKRLQKQKLAGRDKIEQILVKYRQKESA